MQSTTIYGPLPRTTMSQDQLREMVIGAITLHAGSLQFGSIVSQVTRQLKTTKGAFDIPAQTTYTGGLDEGDIARIREIVWDFIILRYLTPGDYHHDSWPHLSITEKGKAFFDNGN